MKRGHLGPNTRAYTRVGPYSFEVLVGAYENRVTDDPRESAEQEHGWKPIWLKWGNPRYKRSTYLSLTGMTLEELEALKKVINIGIDEAMIIAKDLDEKAVELMYEGTEEVPFRALASAPPYFERQISLEYKSPVET